MLIDIFNYIARHWIEVQGRTPLSVLTCLLKRNHPGLIEYKGKIVVASTWKHYQAATDTSGKSKADLVAEGFWLILCLNLFLLSGSCFHFEHLSTSCFQFAK